MNIAIDNLFAQTQPLMAPVLKANKLAVANMEKIVTLQMDSLRTYVDLGMGQLKAAVEVNNPEDLRAFVNSQVEVASTIRQRLLNDTKALADLGTNYKTEINKLTEENVGELTQKTVEAVDAAVKNVQKAA